MGAKFEKKYDSKNWNEPNYVERSKPIISPDGKFYLLRTESDKGAGHVAEYEVKINIEGKTFKILDGLFSSIVISPRSNYIMLDHILVDVISRQAFDLRSKLRGSYCGIFRWAKNGTKIIVYCHDAIFEPEDSDEMEYFQIVLRCHEA